MPNVLDRLVHSVRESDPESGRSLLEPLRPGDNVIGTLSVDTRRIFALMALQVKERAKHEREHERIAADPVLLADEALLDRWIADNRILVARFEILRALLKMSIYSEIPIAVCYEYLELREGFQVIWTRDPTPGTGRVSDAATAIFADILKGPAS